MSLTLAFLGVNFSDFSCVKRFLLSPKNRLIHGPFLFRVIYFIKLFFHGQYCAWPFLLFHKIWSPPLCFYTRNWFLHNSLLLLLLSLNEGYRLNAPNSRWHLSFQHDIIVLPSRVQCLFIENVLICPSTWPEFLLIWSIEGSLILSSCEVT